MTLNYLWLESPLGRLLLAGDARGLQQIRFPLEQVAPDPAWQAGETPLLAAVREQLEAYFAGRLRQFELPLNPHGTVFQKTVWQALTRVPFGRTCSYGELAADIGRPGASRAVGAANGANPIPIVVPCHRVIGANGTLTGFGGGLPSKAWLLEHEQARAASGARQAELWS